LQIMLDKGQEDDWFGSNFVVILAITAGVCLTALIIYKWFHQDPIVDVRLFKNANFATANMMIFMVGAISFATTVLMPQFLQTLMGIHRSRRAWSHFLRTTFNSTASPDRKQPK
jgi:MFS transporter, DHA2 family, multidrug resistance protein